MEEDFIKASEIVLKKVSKDNPNYSLFVCGLYGIIRSFSKYIDVSIIEKVFLDCDINIYKGKLSDVFKYDINGTFDDEAVDGVSHPYYNYYYDLKNGTFAVDVDSPFIYINDSTPNNTINSFIHEFLHLLKAYNVPYDIDHEFMVERHGINLHSMYFDGSNIFDYISGVCLDEGFNVMDTSRCLEEVKGLSLFCTDSNILSYLSSLDMDTLSDNNGYEIEVLLLEKLYKNDYFRNNFHKAVFSGDVNSFEDDFNYICGDKDSYSDFNKTLDLILDSIEDLVDEEFLAVLCDNITDFINSYLEKLKCKVKVNY